MKPHGLRASPRFAQEEKRVGRGGGSGGATSGPGGPRDPRARGGVHAFFEGGQMPLRRRASRS